MGDTEGVGVVQQQQLGNQIRQSMHVPNRTDAESVGVTWQQQQSDLIHQSIIRSPEERSDDTAIADATQKQSLIQQRLLPTFRSRADLGNILTRLNLTVGVELGVRTGSHAALLLRMWKTCRRFVMVDAYGRNAYYDKEQAWFDENLNTMLQQRIVRRDCTQSFLGAMKRPKCRTALEVCQGLTHDCATLYPDQSFDFIYLDALHDRKGVLRDLHRWWPKLRPGGVMAGHDYFDRNHLAEMGFAKAAAKYSINYDGTRDTTLRLTKGAVDDFFACLVEDETEAQVPTGQMCDHFRQVSVSYAWGRPTDELAPSWAVRK